MNLIDFSNVLTIAQTEKRLTRRLKRYWFFVLLSYLAGLGIFIYYSVIHAFFSSFSATLGSINPHYLLSVFGLIFQVIFTIGIIFIGFDIRARDVRERIVEVLDCRPVSNLELIVGRFFALFQMAWFPIVIFCVLLQLIGWLLPLLGAPIGNTVELNSLLSFAILISIPSIFFSIAMVFLVTLLVKNRVLAVILSLGVLGGLLAGILNLPSTYYPYFDNFGTTIAAPFPTDMITTFARPEGWPQRIGFLVISLAFLGFAAAIHPRLDDSNRKRTAIISSAILTSGLALLVASSLWFSSLLTNQDWLDAHDAAENAAVPDIVRMQASLVIDPGKTMTTQLQLEISAYTGSSLDTALFSLNPGFSLGEVTDSNGQPLNYSHENGLLEIDLPAPLVANQTTVINLSYAGKPHPRYAYIDSRLKMERASDYNARGLQGTEAGFFDKQFVALMPGNYWLPLAGNDFNRDDTRQLPRDFFNLDLEVDIPGDWLAAGPGLREELSSQNPGRKKFRFTPEPQLSEVALVASQFTSFSTDIGGIHFEMLMYPQHTRNFEVLAPMQEEIESWVENRLTLARDAGLIYPFDAFTLVEVPNGLRVYKGGWRMDTALAPPGMMLMSESGFPTSRFDFSVQPNTNNTASGTTGNQGLSVNGDSFQNVSFDRLLTFFASDLSGGNIFMGMSRSFFTHHTSATGDEAIALNFILDMLATLVISDERYYFSMYNDINSTVTNLIETIVQGGAAGQSITQRTINNASADVEVWNSALNSSLANIDTEQDPEQTINLLTLKGGELAQAIYDTLGASTAGEFLARILQEHRGGSFQLADVVNTLALYDEGLSVLFEETINSTELPGFVVDDADLYRLSDGDSGEQRYQLLVALRNDEPVSGFTRISWMIEEDGDTQEFYSSAPIRIEGQSAIEYGIVLSVPPVNVLITPYLSLNRSQFLARLFNNGEASTVRNVEAFEGVRPIPWNDQSERIIADDLDLSFYVIDDNGQSTPDRVAAEGEALLDQGILAFQGNAPNNWTRVNSASSFGKYRHTFVTVMAGEGDKKAILTSDIPQSGLWDLEIHIPGAAAFRANNMKGIWSMDIITSSGRETIAFDNRAAISGWNLVGAFELSAGEVQVEINNQTDGITVVVDAIAWTPVNSNNGTQQ